MNPWILILTLTLTLPSLALAEEEVECFDPETGLTGFCQGRDDFHQPVRDTTVNKIQIRKVRKSKIFQDYRYNEQFQRCQDSAGIPGKNKGFFGECGQTTQNYSNIDLSNVPDRSFKGADLTRSILKNTRGQRVWFTKATLNGVDFSNSNLVDCHMRFASMQVANFSNSHLEKCDFHEAVARLANFSSAHLDWADFSNANLRGSSFKGAELRYSTLKGANLDCVDLSNAKLDGANLEGASYNAGTQFPVMIYTVEEFARQNGMHLSVFDNPCPAKTQH